MKITAVLLKRGQTRLIISPMGTKTTEKREKREREREREKKKTSTDPYSERPGFHKSRYIYIYIYIYNIYNIYVNTTYIYS